MEKINELEDSDSARLQISPVHGAGTPTLHPLPEACLASKDSEGSPSGSMLTPPVVPCSSLPPFV